MRLSRLVFYFDGYLKIVTTVLKAWIVGAVSDIEDAGHIASCRVLHLFIQRLEVPTLGLPELYFHQRSWICFRHLILPYLLKQS